MKKLLGFLILALLGGYCQSVDVDQPVYLGEEELGILLPISGGERVEHAYFQLAYSELHEGAYWVFYHLTPSMLEGTAERKDNFRPDPKVSTLSATPDDYVSTGYDRGHLCPAASMVINQEAMDETFFMSNMSPQHPSLNRGRWKSLETKEREWAARLDTLYIATGAIYTDSLGVIGQNEVTVPRAYYKILWDGEQHLIGFIMPNEKCPEVL
ncbi:MAG: DNA/RNA non-specific endonuclease [Prolixibacteraceae bacterium]|nr:DNA/RNA non-specific endonuclease [Prolixibacteraceae bacterium]